MSSTIRIGLIGAGSVARRIHAPGLRLCEGVEIAAVADPDPAAAGSLGAKRVGDDPERLIQDADIDAAVVATPNHLHHPLVLAAAAAGKHVLCEKPLAMNAAEAEAMVAAADEAGVVHMTAFTYGFMPAARFLRRLVEDGEFGELRSVRGSYLMAPALHTKGWRSRRRWAGSGVLGDIGSHLLHIVLGLAGDIAEVSADQRSFGDDPDCDVEDWIAMTTRFRSGAVGVFEFSRICPGRGADIGEDMFIEVYGSKGGAALSMQEPRRLRVCLGAAGRDPTTRLREIDVPAEFIPAFEGDPRWSYRYDQARRFIANIRAGEVREPSLRDGLRCQRVLDAALRSAETRAWTAVDSPAGE